MPEGQVLEFAGLSKRFGPVLAVDGLSARVEPGSVTGFLGPNGAGKTTTLRMLLGLVRASSGEATIGGVPYAKLDNPLQTVGAVLEASSFHPGRTAANHLKVLAQASGLPAARVDQALGTVGLADVAGRKVGGYSLGMRQRLGLAAALLGDPGVLVLDEPVNGLDPEGITWIRGLLQELARQGRTVLMSSHLLSEVQQTVDRLLIISNGRLVFQGGIEDLVDPTEYATVVDAPDRASLSAALESAGVPYEVLRSGLTVRDPDVAAVGRVAADAGVALSLLQRRGPALEEVFFELVNGLRVHPSARGAEEETVDAAAPAITEDEPSTPVPEPEAPADVDAPAAGDAPAEAEAPTETGVPAEAEAVAAPEPGVAPSPEPASDAQPEPAPHTASFAVAATGVIDIVPPTEPESTPETEPESASEPQSEPEPEPVSEPEPAAEPDPTEPSADRNEVVAGEPEELPPDDWRHEEKTQADWDADAFFHAFDGSSDAAPGAQADPAEPDAAASDAAGAATPDADESAEDAASRPDDHSHDGGDGR